MQRRPYPVILGQFEGSLIKEPGRSYPPATINNPRWDYQANRDYCTGWYFWKEGGDTFLPPTMNQMSRLCAEGEMLVFCPGHHSSSRDGKLILKMARLFPDKVYLLINVEDETHLDFGQRYFHSRREAMSSYHRALMNHTRWFARLHGDDEVTPVYLRRLKRQFGYRYCAWPTMLWSVHHYYKMGYDLVMREAGAWYSNSILNFAFQRGGARQYDKQWGMWLSTWGGARHRIGRCCTAYDQSGNHLTGLSADHILLHYITAWLSDADVIMSQDTLYTHWGTLNPITRGSSNADLNRVQFKREKPNQPSLSPVGEKTSAFARFVRERAPRRLGAITPFALLLDPNHGYETSGLWQMNRHVWRNRVPYEQGDFMLDNLFEWFYPGYRLSGNSFKSMWNPNVHWTSEQEYCDLMEKGFDQRPFEQHLCATRYGDSVDMLVSGDITPDILANYKVVILAGGLIVDADLLRVLAEYCKQGGVVIGSGRHFMSREKNTGVSGISALPNDDALTHVLGIKRLRYYEPGLGYTKFVSSGECVFDPNYEYVSIEPTTADIVARNNFRDGMIARNKLGRGGLYFLAADYGQTLGNFDLLPSTKRFLEIFLPKFLPVQVKGPLVQYHVMQCDEGVVVGLVNNGRKIWAGEVCLKNIHGKRKSAKSVVDIVDIWAENKFSIKAQEIKGWVSVKIRIEPFSFRLLLFRGLGWNG